MDILPHPEPHDFDEDNDDPLLDAGYRNSIVQILEEIATAADESIQRGDARFIRPLHFAESFDHEIKHLFAIDPKWYAPLLTTPKGLEVLGVILLYGQFFVIDDYDDNVDQEQLMRAYLYIQSLIASDPDDDECKNGMLLRIPLAFHRSLFKALRHYLHPDQADALSQLKASITVPAPALAPSPHNVPPEALPLLFPNIDTTQFDPQFDWFIYLLSQFSPVDEASYQNNLSTLLDTISHPTEFLSLKHGLTLDKVFTHNHLINSYDEFLLYKLPQVLPLIQSDFQVSHSPSSHLYVLFPYFPDQHPLVPSITSKDQFSALLSNPTAAFSTYFISMFILGPLIRETVYIPHFETHPVSTSLFLSTKLAFHQYRSLHLRTTFTASSRSALAPPTSDSSLHNVSITNTTAHNLQPPGFTTSPSILLELALLTDRKTEISLDYDRVRLVAPITWSHQQPPIVSQTYYRFLFHILSHYFPDESTRNAHFNAALDSILSGHRSLGAVAFSYTLYQHGYITLHQHAYHRLLNANPNSRSLINFLLTPFTRSKVYKANWNEFAQHIALCVHAGFLAPPPTPIPDTTIPSDQVGSTIGDFTPSDWFHALTTIRGMLYAILVRLTGFISYFPQSTQLLADAVHTVASQISFFSPPRLHYLPLDKWRLPFLPPHSSAIPDPRDTFPRLKAALVDDEGNLYAVTYASGGGKEEAGGSKGRSRPTQFQSFFSSSQGAPRHKHILQRTAVDDLRVCINWGERDVEQCPELAANQDCNPYFRPQLSAEDITWIPSEDNQKNLKLPETRELQTHLTAYYRQVNEVETAMVTAQMHKVLTKAYEAGLCDASNAGQKRKHPPPSSHNAPMHTSSAESAPSRAISPFPLRAQHRAYPFPDPPQIPNIVQDKVGFHRTTFTEQRGVVYQRDAHSFFYDHNYCTALIAGDYVSYQPPAPPTRQEWWNPPSAVKIGGTVSVFDYFRQRSEWALELLMMGCFGLDAASTQKPRPPWVTSIHQPSLPTFSAQAGPSIQTPPPTRIQQCKDHILQHLPILLNTIEPTPTVILPRYLARLCYYHDTLTHLTLLSALPLYDTLATLPPSPLETGKEEE